MKKICFVTAARSEYGVLKWLMKDVATSKEFTFQLIVTGAHLSYAQGHTIDQIIEDGFDITRTIDVELDTSSTANIAGVMGKMAQSFAKAFEELKPDYLVVLGDRYELLPICSAAYIMRIAIVHLSGGDVTEGAIDDGIRNAITMLADYHFPGTEDSANNIIRMRNSSQNVWAVGEPGLDSFYREDLLSRKALASCLGLDVNMKWVLMTYHPETLESVEYNLNSVAACIDALKNHREYQVIMTYANADFGGEKINEYLVAEGAKYNCLKVIPSLGNFLYLSVMKQVEFVIGNSSSGIIETPFLNIPTINIGNRQKGRYQCGNIIQCIAEKMNIEEAIKTIGKRESMERHDLFYWGDGHTSERILEIFKKNLM